MRMQIKCANTSQAMGIAALVSLFIFPLATITGRYFSNCQRLEGAQTGTGLPRRARTGKNPGYYQSCSVWGYSACCDCNYFGNRFNSLNFACKQAIMIPTVAELVAMGNRPKYYFG